MAFLKGVKDELTVRTVAEVDQGEGKLVKVPFKVTYKRLSVDEVEQASSRIDSGESSMRDVIRQYLVRWDDLEGADGEPVEFNDENLSYALNDPDYLSALAYGYICVQSGKRAADKAIGKN